ncbi:MAG: hypothetical protein QOG68_1733 [Solirubrobacteraceae bacterium]|jgi:gamma-glutamylcyclotransferase (GGCT)/AIG2-like uncharacterized protein YtfP|nr:hypothetical protein [Solirubrobacteraceae bacterium]
MADLLAVYGTLMSGQAYEGRPDVERLMRSVGACRIPGVLFSEGDYPWLVADEGEVAGELYEVPDPATLDLLDAYENEGRHTEDGAGNYARIRMRLLEPDVEAWVYVWEGPPRGEPIDAGDWRVWLALRGDR